MALIKKNPPDGRNFITVCAEDPNNPGDIYALAIDPVTGNLLVNASFTGSVAVALSGADLDGDNVRMFSACNVGALAFTGTGLDDLTALGRYLGTASLLKVVVEIDAAGTPDTFKVSIDGGSTFISTGVAIATDPTSGDVIAQDIHQGLTIIFGASTGHTLGDKWEFDVTPGHMVNPRVEDGHGSEDTNPSYVEMTNIAVAYDDINDLWKQRLYWLKTKEEIYDNTIGKSTSVDSSVVDLENIKIASITVDAIYHASATAGIEVIILSSLDGIVWDTVEDPYAEGFEPSFGAGATRRKTYNLDTPPLYMKAQITNLDTVQDVDVRIQAVKVE